MNRRVIVTRPSAQAESWQNVIAQAGFEFVSIPALEITPFEDAERVQAVSCVIQKLDEFHCLIFVSQNAVAYGFDWIEDYWPQFPLGVHCLAIGAKTEAVLQHRMKRLSSTQTTAQEHSLMTSEALLEHPELQDVDDKKILVFRGSGGRTKISDVLTERGASVQFCELYQRVLPENALDILCKSDINAEKDILTIFSGESLENFHFLLSKAKIEHWQNLPIIAPSKRVAKHAQELGFDRVYTAKNASEDEMLSALLIAHSS